MPNWRLLRFGGTGTGSMGKNKIGNKIMATYFIILVITFVVTALSFHWLSQRYVIREARVQLQTEGKRLANLFANIPLDKPNILNRLPAQRELKIAGRFIDAKMMVVNADNQIVFTNFDPAERRAFRLVAGLSQNVRGFVAESVPIQGKNGEFRGQVLLATRIKDLNSLNQLMRRTEMVSLTIAALVALLTGFLLNRSITGPIAQLKQGMQAFSLPKGFERLMIRTGDEIEELAECFNVMAEKLQAYNEQQKQFLQNTSHELKTPLMSIQGYAEAIKDGVVEGEELQESLDIIIAESKRLKKTVEEIIYLTKLENTDEQINLELCGVEEIIAEAVKSVKPLADEKGIVIERIGDRVIPGRFDREKMKRALINILGNCIRYANSRITIDGKTVGRQITLRITDDGKGFAQGEGKRIFDRFYKGENGGTGLGLAITKAIIEGHGGRIEAYTNQPSGAVFQISLPGL